MPIYHSVFNVKVLVGTFNQEKALVGAFSVIVKSDVEPMEHYTTTQHYKHSCSCWLEHWLSCSLLPRLLRAGN